ncbi:sensor histidine kinase [Phytopseudomonas daroniae]|uniref:sensor histidine kinase n=1 Tax=Phytopseudomonas daroniae TaxID=2487519 RepID=UPI0010383F3E|nr:ATP-binding protein [Pseudomonas daroniae]TBU77316.1 two-component sensor histidine kinase [Pseudomonas daroniae]
MRFVKTGWLNSLRVQVLLVYVAGAALSILLIVLASGAIVNSQGSFLSGLNVAATAADMAGELHFDSDGVPDGFEPRRDGSDIDFEWVFDYMTQDSAYRVLDASGNVVLASTADEDFWRDSAAHRLERGRFEFAHEGVAMLGATTSVEHDGRIWYLQLAASKRFMQLTYDAFAVPFTVVGISLFSVVLLFVFGPCVYVTLRYTLRPLLAVSDSAAAISPRSLHARLRTRGVPSEIMPLVDSFNRVLERLEHGYRIQQEFLATAAHELKTPLALIQAQIGLMERGNERDCLLNDVRHMTRQVQQLLQLAEASEAQNYSFAPVDVSAVANEAVDYLQRMAGAVDVRLVPSVEAGDVQWSGDRSALFTLLKNLLENAIQHAPPGTEVGVEVDAGSISVRDRGPGVAPEHLATMFSRFWRGKHRRDDGAGLGLAICQEIALAHGWTLSAHRAEPGLILRVSRPDGAAVPG